MTENQKPLVYSCSGCSNVAQLANNLAITMDREGVAQMSCIAGVGGNVKKLVNLAKSGRDILALDGCKLACVKSTLSQLDITPKWHLELTEFGFKKRNSESCSIREFFQAKKYTYDMLGLISVKQI
jgi:uncharacterized metal-binding protein